MLVQTGLSMVMAFIMGLFAMSFVDSHNYAHDRVDVFISGSHRNSAIQLVGSELQKANFSVFHSGFSIPDGVEFHSYIRHYLEHSDTILVCWCKHSVRSEYVNAEAEFGRVCHRLVACKTEPCDPFPPFNTFQTADLTKWKGGSSHQDWSRLLELLKHRKQGNVLPFVQNPRR